MYLSIFPPTDLSPGTTVFGLHLNYLLTALQNFQIAVTLGLRCIIIPGTLFVLSSVQKPPFSESQPFLAYILVPSFIRTHELPK